MLVSEFRLQATRCKDSSPTSKLDGTRTKTLKSPICICVSEPARGRSLEAATLSDNCLNDAMRLCTSELGQARYQIDFGRSLA